MGWAAIRDAVQQAVVLGSGLDPSRVVWKYQDAEEPALNFIALSLSNIRTIGQDFVQTSTDLGRPAGQEIALTVTGMREVGLELECLTASTADDQDALALIEQVKSSFLLPNVRNLLGSVGFAPFDPGPVAFVPEIVGVGFRGRATCTVRCYVPAPVVVAYAGFIASVSGNITVRGGAQDTGSGQTTPFSAP